MNIIGNQAYTKNVEKVKTIKREYETKRFEDFTFYSLDTFYVISYFSSYKASSRQKTFKSYKGALNAWALIVSGETTYVNF